MTDSIKRQFDAEMSTREDGSDEAGTRTVEGHAAVFNERTLIGSRRFGFVEQIARGAFDDVLGDDVRYLENHGGMPFARTKSGTLRLSINDRGLFQSADFDTRNQQAMDHFSAIDRGDMDQMSFAFTILDDDVRQLPEDDPDFPGMVERTINKIGRLYDVSGVTYPAYEGADIGVRSLDPKNDAVLRSQIEDVLTRAAAPGEEETVEDLVERASTEPSSSTETGDQPEDDMSVARAKGLAAANRRYTKES